MMDFEGAGEEATRVSSEPDVASSSSLIPGCLKGEGERDSSSLLTLISFFLDIFTGGGAGGGSSGRSYSSSTSISPALFATGLLLVNHLCIL